MNLDQTRNRRGDAGSIAGRFWAGRATGIGTLALASLLDPRLLAGGRPRRSPRIAGRAWSSPPHFAPRAKRIIYLYMAGGPSHLETFDHKPKLAEMHGQPMPESFTKGQPIAQLQGQKLTCFAPQHPFDKVRPVGPGDQRDLPAPGHGRRRHLHHPLDGDRGDQPRSGPHVHEHRHDDLGPAGDGLVAHLRPGQRERQPARLRRADLDRASSARRSRSPRGSGTAASCPAGSRASSSARKGDPVLYVGRPGGRHARPAARRGRRRAAAQRDRERGGRRPGDRHAHQPSTRWRSACRPACRS